MPTAAAPPPRRTAPHESRTRADAARAVLARLQPRRTGWLTPALLLYLAAFAAWFATGAGGGARATIVNAAYLPVDLLAVLLAMAVVRLPCGDRATRRAWTVVALALCAQTLGDAAWLWLEATGARTYPSVADVAYVGTYPLWLLGLLAMPVQPRSRRELAILALDGAIVIAAGFVVIWWTSLGAALHEGVGTFERVLDVLYPVGDLVLVLAAVTAWLRAPAGRVRRPVVALVAGLCLLIVADLAFAQLTQAGLGSGALWVDLVWIAALCCFAIAADQQLRVLRGAAQRPSAPALRAPRATQLPHVAVAVSWAVVLHVASGLPLGPLAGLLVAQLVITVLVTARQLLAVRERRQLAVRLERAATTDSLTGLLTRRRFMELVEAELQRPPARRGCGLVIVDVDFFKAINDRHGHLAGDAVLEAVAERVRAALRREDLVCRYGGDELVVFLPGAEHAETRRCAERITAAAAARHVAVPGARVPVSLSAGTAWSPEAAAVNDLLARADEALYVVKQSGRGSALDYEDLRQPAPDAAADAARSAAPGAGTDGAGGDGDGDAAPAPGRRGGRAIAALAIANALYAVQLLWLREDPFVDRVFDAGVQNALLWSAPLLAWLGARRHEGAPRLVWRLVAACLAAWSLANTLWFALGKPDLSIADTLWVGGYLPLYAAVVVGVRERMDRAHRSVWLDGLIAALGMTAFSAALLWPTLRAAATGADGWTLAAHLGYPLADALLMMLLAGACALTRMALGRRLQLLVAGLLVTLAADGAYLLNFTMGESGAELQDAGYVASQLIMAAGVWAGPPDGPTAPARFEGWRVVALPALFGVAALALLAAAVAGGVDAVPAYLAVATLAAVFARGGLTFREHALLLRDSREARFDELTGLLNRSGFYLAADDRIAAARDSERPLAMLLLDLDRFKELNDTFGHHVGDELLREVATRLRGALGDVALTRLGGDEFAALVEAGPGAAGGWRAARRTLEVLERPFALDGAVMHVGGSVGLAAFPHDAGSRAALLRAADVAMYQAKRRRTGVERYAARNDDHSREQVALANELHAALSRDELVLWFQPKSDLATGAVIGVEALVRWEHPRRGLLFPDAFIALAEQHGFMRRLTLRVLELAMQQRLAWQAQGIELPVAVNVSAGNLLDARFYDDVAELVARRRLPSGALQLEITENTVMVDPDRALDTLARLGELGITFALDDFGTGYSSLSQLKRLPVAELKIDRSFVIDMIDDHEDAAIVRSTIDLGRSLNLHVVAEGVETQAHWDRLAEYGCHTAQGYFLARPLPAGELTRWLRRRAAPADAGARR